jgi:DNA-directed RNA polymerase specialized sigma subunit
MQLEKIKLNLKLNHEDILNIRRLLDEGLFQSEIAKMYGISQNTVSKIKLKLIHKERSSHAIST